MKKNLKMIMAIIITAILCIGTSVFATASYMASQMSYKKADGTTITVQDALNDLYSKKNDNKIYLFDLNRMTKNDEDYLKLSGSGYWSNDNWTYYRMFDCVLDRDDYSWCSANKDPNQYIIMEFAENVTIKKISMYPQGASLASRFPKDIELQVSNDGENWTTVLKTQVDSCEYRWHNIDITNYKTAKYFKIISTSNFSTNNWTSIGEMKLYGV